MTKEKEKIYSDKEGNNWKRNIKDTTRYTEVRETVKKLFFFCGQAFTPGPLKIGLFLLLPLKISTKSVEREAIK